MKPLFIIGSITLNIIFFALVIRHFLLKPVVKPTTGFNYWLHRDELFESLTIDSSSVVFAGDSHIENFEVSELFNSLNCKNRGINYDNSAGLLNRLPEITKGKPQKMFIEIGTNDIINGVPINETIHNITKIINFIQKNSPNTKIFIIGVLASSTAAKHLNSGFLKAAQAKKITFVDVMCFFNKDGLKRMYDSGDGIHLNSKGYLALYKLLRPMVR